MPMSVSNAAALDPQDTDRPVVRRWVDVTDILTYLSRYGAVSGIQRVVSEVAPELAVDLGTEFVAFSQARSALVHVPKSHFLDIIRRLHDRKAGGPRSELGLEVQRTLESLEILPPVAGSPGDALLILGAAWIHPGFFKAVQRMKSRGTGVTILIYDLIPVMSAGFPQELVAEFSRYLHYAVRLANRTPCISYASRADWELWCRDRDLRAPPGGVIRLGSSIDEARIRALPVRSAWPRPFVLMVGTVESRKDHGTAFRAWEILSGEMPREQLPDLVCVGRIGWNATPFLEAVEASRGMGGLVHLLSQELDDEALEWLYRDCMFTIYPSTYEGWGLPVTESLSRGKPVITTACSSLPEAGGRHAVYVSAGDHQALAAQVRDWLLAPDVVADHRSRIEREFRTHPWSIAARQLENEMHQALRSELAGSEIPTIPVGREIGLGRIPLREGSSHDGVGFLEHLNSTHRLPLSSDVHDIDAETLGDLAFWTDAGERHPWGWLLPAGGMAEFRLARPVSSAISLIICTRRGPDRMSIKMHGPVAVTTTACTQGAPIVVDLGAGELGGVVGVRMTWRPIAPTHGNGALGLESFTVLDSDRDPLQGQQFRLLLDAELSRSAEIAKELDRSEARAQALREGVLALDENVRSLERKVMHFEQREREFEERGRLIRELIEERDSQRLLLDAISVSRSWRFIQTSRRLLRRSRLTAIDESQ